MQTPTFYADFASESVVLAAVERLENDPTASFVKKAKLLGLGPSDFRYADLSGCDFSNCDLRNFDFTGADLRGTSGLFIEWDGSTILSDAILNGSPFASEVKTKEDEAAHPDWEQTYLQVSGQDEATAFRQVISLFRRDDAQAKRKALFVVKKMFFGTSTSVVRNNMLYCLSAHVRDATETREFLTYLVAKHTGEPAILRTAVRVMSEVCFRDPVAVDIFFACLSSRDEGLRLASMRGLIKTPKFEKIASRLCRQMADEPLARLRRQFLEAFTRKMKVFESVSYSGQVIDYGETISSDQFESLVVNFATQRIRAELRAGGDLSWQNYRALFKDALRYTTTVRQVLGQLKRLGLPIEMWDDEARVFVRGMPALRTAVSSIDTVTELNGLAG